jgi:hypothetical protein
MSEKGKDGLMTCLFSRHDIEIQDVKFFRGRRNDVITADEICEQARSAIMQHRLGTAEVSTEAPRSTHRPIDVQEFIAQL